MSGRDDDMEKLAKAFGWGFYGLMFSAPGQFIIIPFLTDGIATQLAFVGRIAEELIPLRTNASLLNQRAFVASVLRDCTADTDLAWAAVRLALSKAHLGAGSTADGWE